MKRVLIGMVLAFAAIFAHANEGEVVIKVPQSKVAAVWGGYIVGAFAGAMIGGNIAVAGAAAGAAVPIAPIFVGAAAGAVVGAATAYATYTAVEYVRDNHERIEKKVEEVWGDVKESLPKKV